MDPKEAFLLCAKKYEDLNEQMSLLREELNKAMEAVGVGNYVQDPTTTIVYQIVKPAGKYVYFNDLDYLRTKKDGERAGTLSLKKAEEAGFTLIK